MKNKMAELLAIHNPSERAVPLLKRTQALFERLTASTGTGILPELSDTDVTVEVSTYLLWKSLNG